MNVRLTEGRQGSEARPERRHKTAPSSGGRVVAVTPLSSSVPDGFIIEQLCQAIHEQTGKSVILVQLEPSTESRAQRWARLWGRLNGEFAFQKQLIAPTTGHQFSRLPLGVDGGRLEANSLHSALDHVRKHFDYVVVHARADLPVGLLLESLVRADRTYLLSLATPENFYHRELLLRELRAYPHTEKATVRTIVCQELGHENTSPFLQEAGESVHGFIRGCPPRRGVMGPWRDRVFQADLRRWAREIGRCRLGLALSSGGARGLAHIGVIQVLEENGIEVDVVAGCSMGAYVGSVWAYGYDGMFLEKLAREVENRWGIFQLIDPFLFPRQGFLRGEKVKRRLKRSIGDVHFSELVRPLRIVATNLSTLERTVFTRGEVAAAVHASSAIPGACAPVRVDGELYIDGGIADPMPVDVLEDMGVERIIAVNTIPTAAYLRCRMEMEREQDELRGRKRPGRVRLLINQYLNYFAPGNILDTIMRSVHGAQMHVAEYSCMRADLVLRPLSFDGRWHDFRNPGKYIRLGRTEAESHLEELKALANRKETNNEERSADKAMATVA